MAEHNDIGKKGEDIACKYLTDKGYAIHVRNWQFGKFEIDIIAEDGQDIVFIEVKARSGVRWGNPEDAVSNGKIKRIVEAADFYLQDRDITMPARFDVIAITFVHDFVDIKHFEDAFLSPICFSISNILGFIDDTD